MLSEAFVSSPANSRVTPNARTIGHAVGAGSTISALALSTVVLLEISENPCDFASFSDQSRKQR